MPRSDVPGEQSSPTQPFPVKPPPLVPLELNEQQLWAADSSHLARCRERLQAIRNRGPFTPPSTKWTILYPSTIGGANWSGGAFDPARGLLFVPTNDEVHLVRLNPLSPDKLSEDRRPRSSKLVVRLALVVVAHRHGSPLRPAS